MLEITRSITFTGNSMINGRAAEGYSATISSRNPRELNIQSWHCDEQLYKDNREQCRKDSAEFEDLVYEAQDKMIAQHEANGNTTEVGTEINEEPEVVEEPIE